MKQKHVNIGSIDTLVLCGGRGARLKPIVSDKPKILANIGGSPFIKYLLKYLENEGIKRIILCTGYMYDQIEDWVQSSYHGDLDILFSREKNPQGTGGAIKNAQKLILGNNFLVINGDTFIELNYRVFIESFLDKDAVGLFALKKLIKTEAYGNVKVDSMNRIVSFIEKENKFDHNNNDGLINVGVYLLNKVCLDVIPSNTKVSFERSTMKLILKESNNSIYGFYCEGSFIDIGTPRNYYRAHEILQKYA